MRLLANEADIINHHYLSTRLRTYLAAAIMMA